METRNVLTFIFSALFIFAFVFVLIWGIVNFNKVKDAMSGTGVYTEQDVNNAYEDGYNKALENKAEYDKLINDYRDTITNQTDQISQLNSEITLLTNNNKDYKKQITTLEEQKTNLQTQVDNLTQISNDNNATITNLNADIISLNNDKITLQNTITENEKTITNLRNQIQILEEEIFVLESTNSNNTNLIAEKNLEIQNLNNQITLLNNDITNKNNTINSLNGQVSNLQTTVTQLERTNELNVQTIANLNNQIVTLNRQISDMTIQIQNNSSNVTTLNNKIIELEKSVAYYEEYIANLENGEQVVATFEFDGSVYNIQIVNKNSTVSVVTPTSTNYVIFNYWMVDNARIDLATYPITANTKIIANVTYKYDVKYMLDETEYNKQIVTKDNISTTPTAPVKEGYEFDGWSINGVDIVNTATYPITQNTTFVAIFTKLHTVTFVYEDSTYTTQVVRNNQSSTSVSVDNTTYKVFNGWKLNGVIVDVTTQKITADTTFVADIIYKYDVNFVVDNNTYTSQIVVKNGYPTIPTAPTKNGYEFDGWSKNGTDIVQVNTIAITDTTTFTAVFTKLHIVTFMYEDEVHTTQTIRNGNSPSDVNVTNTNYKVFNGWKLNDVIVDITTQIITADTTFVADITYKHLVIFKNDNTQFSSEYVISGEYATLTSRPSKAGHRFKGWSVDGSNIISLNTYQIIKDTTFIAVFEINYFTIRITNEGSKLALGENVTILYTAEVPYDTKLSDIGYMPTKENHKLVGYRYYYKNLWGYASSTSLTMDATISTDMVLQPVFESVVQTVEFSVFDEIIKSEIYPTGSNIELTLINAPSYENMRFLGWSASYEITTAYDKYYEISTTEYYQVDYVYTTVAGNTTTTFKAVYEYVFTGGFATEDGNYILYFGYDISNNFKINSSTTTQLSTGTYTKKLETGECTYFSDVTTSTVQFWTGNYDKNLDAWIMTLEYHHPSTGALISETTYTLYRTHHTYGIVKEVQSS